MDSYNLFKRFNILMAVIIGMFCLVQQKTESAPCPCDIYKAAGTPCVAAHSMVRALYESYNGPLYQVRRTSDKATKDIGVLSPGGFANTSVQDSFLNGKPGTISIIYDQSPDTNHLRKSPKALWLPNGGNEANATDGKIKVNGHTIYGMSVIRGSNIAYRNNATKGIATKDQAESMYMIVDGKKYSDQCCFDYGNAETSGKDDGNGTMEAVYFGNDITWGGKGEGNGPWIAADLENGVYKSNKGGWQSQSLSVPTAKSVIANFAVAMLKGPSGNRFGLKAGNAESGKLVTMWDGVRPTPNYSPKQLQGAIILGTGGDGSNGGVGIFYEGVMTMGNPPDSIDDKIQENIVAAGFGKTTTSVLSYDVNKFKTASMLDIHYNKSNTSAAISYILNEAQHVNLAVFDQQGRQIASLVNGNKPAGNHETIWDMKQVPAGVYVMMLSNGDHSKWAETLVKR
jgi:hypothetical protein